MFFLIRCTFWLTIVFTSMPWPWDRQLQSQNLLTEATASVIRSAAGRAVGLSGAQCLAAPQLCVEAARHLQVLSDSAAPPASGQGSHGQPDPKRPHVRS
ncbi:MAG: hypothetical protein NVSMB26_08370 [Beijerinckiaceae bacterium]